MSDGKKSVENEETTAKTDEIVENEAIEASEDVIEDAEQIEDAAESDAEEAEDPTEEEVEPEAEAEEEPDTPEPEPEPVAAEAPAQAAPAPEARKSGFFGTVLGGVIAAGLGFVGSQYLGDLGLFDHGTSDETASALRAQDRDIAELTAAFDSLKSELDVPDVTGAVTSAIAPLSDQVEQAGQSLTTLTAQLSGVDARLTEVEKRPVGESQDISVAVSAYERELEAMRGELAAQRELNAQFSENVGAAASAATATISRAAADAAVMRIGAAIDSGAPFATALPGLSSYDIPAALTDVAETGVPSLAALSKGFDAPARAAVAAAQAELAAEGDAAQKLGAFLRSQTGFRSTVPREGDGADAVISRAEAAVGNGALGQALDEIRTLPDTAQQAMSDWIAQATARVNAETALTALAAQIAGE